MVCCTAHVRNPPGQVAAHQDLCLVLDKNKLSKKACLWEVLVLVGKIDLDDQIEVAQVVITGCGRVCAHHQLTLLLQHTSHWNVKGLLELVHVVNNLHQTDEAAILALLVS